MPPSSECCGEGTVAPHTPSNTGMPKPQPNLTSPTSPSNLDPSSVGLYCERPRCRDGCKDEGDGRERSRRRWYLTVIVLLYVGLVTSFCLNVSLLLKATPSKEDREEIGNLVSSTKSPIEESYSFACLAKGKLSYLVTQILIQKPPRPLCGWLLLLLSLQSVPALPTLLLPGTNSHPEHFVDSTSLFPSPSGARRPAGLAPPTPRRTPQAGPLPPSARLHTACTGRGQAWLSWSPLTTPVPTPCWRPATGG